MGYYIIRPATYRDENNPYQQDMTFGFLQLNLTDPEQHTGLNITPYVYHIYKNNYIYIIKIIRIISKIRIEIYGVDQFHWAGILLPNGKECMERNGLNDFATNGL